MSDATKPTAEDMARDLSFDLAVCENADRRNLNCLSASRCGWPAAIRRALTAEAECAISRDIINKFFRDVNGLPDPAATLAWADKTFCEKWLEAQAKVERLEVVVTELVAACKAARGYGSPGTTDDGIDVPYLLDEAIRKAEGEVQL